MKTALRNKASWDILNRIDTTKSAAPIESKEEYLGEGESVILVKNLEAYFVEAKKKFRVEFSRYFDYPENIRDVQAGTSTEPRSTPSRSNDIGNDMSVQLAPEVPSKQGNEGEKDGFISHVKLKGSMFNGHCASNFATPSSRILSCANDSPSSAWSTPHHPTVCNPEFLSKYSMISSLNTNSFNSDVASPDSEESPWSEIAEPCAVSRPASFETVLHIFPDFAVTERNPFSLMAYRGVRKMLFDKWDSLKRSHQSRSFSVGFLKTSVDINPVQRTDPRRSSGPRHGKNLDTSSHSSQETTVIDETKSPAGKPEISALAYPTPFRESSGNITKWPSFDDLPTSPTGAFAQGKQSNNPKSHPLLQHEDRCGIPNPHNSFGSTNTASSTMTAPHATPTLSPSAAMSYENSKLGLEVARAVLKDINSRYSLDVSAAVKVREGHLQALHHEDLGHDCKVRQAEIQRKAAARELEHARLIRKFLDKRASDISEGRTPTETILLPSELQLPESATVQANNRREPGRQVRKRGSANNLSIECYYAAWAVRYVERMEGAEAAQLAIVKARMEKDYEERRLMSEEWQSALLTMEAKEENRRRVARASRGSEHQEEKRGERKAEKPKTFAERLLRARPSKMSLRKEKQRQLRELESQNSSFEQFVASRTKGVSAVEYDEMKRKSDGSKASGRYSSDDGN